MIKNQRYQTDYDKETDVLYISFGKPKKAIGIEVDQGNVVRVDPFSESVVGITIVDFSYKYGERSESIEEMAQDIVSEMLNKFSKRVKK